MPSKYNIVVENSAPSQRRPAQSVKWASPHLANEGVNMVVDLGCGRLRNLSILRKHFSHITLVDTKLQCERIASEVPNDPAIRLMTIDEFEAEERTYDAVFLISVLHIIDKVLVRKKLLTLTRERLRDLGFFVIDVPSGEHYYRIRCTPGNRFRDGWVMGSGSVKTFYKNYQSKELDRFVHSVTSFELHMKTGVDKHLIRIWRKTNNAVQSVRA